MPFVLEVSGPEAPSPDDLIELRISIERRLISTDPLQISIALPPGVKLVSGELESVVTDGETRRLERKIRLAIGGELPSGDLIVTVSQRGAAWGAHAAKAYRFGRPAPSHSPPTPARDQRPVILDGRNHGQPIRIH